MRIGELARKTGVTVETIRFYERQGLLGEATRSDANYRVYAGDAETRLSFIRRCRSLDIGLAEIARLLHLADSPEADCGSVDTMLDQHIKRVQGQRRELARLERDLKSLRADCDPAKQVRGCGILRDVGPLGADQKR